MRISLPYSLSTNQARNNILGMSGIKSNEEDQWVEKIKESFYQNLDYTQVTKNFVSATPLDCWIYDGNKTDKVLGSFKELYSYPYNPHVFEIGNYISFSYGGDTHDWLITTLDKQLYYNVNGRIERCNITLKFLDSNGNLKSYPAVARDELKRALFDFKEYIITPQGYLNIVTQVNSDTKTIKRNQRFLFGDPYQAFKCVAIINYTDTNTIGLELMVDEISPEDDLVNGIANGLNISSISSTPTTGNFILPSNITSIIQNVTQIYTVNHFVNGTANSDTFTITENGALNSFYQLSVINGNSFSIKSLGYTSTPLVVICTNNSDSSTVSISINLKGLY